MKISSFGEVLWDDFPSGKVLGGAPLNILIRLGGLGAECSIISRKGNDEYGEQLLSLIEAKNVAVDLIQTDNEHATSLVKVILQSDGSASYDIVYPCAWDKITVTEEALNRVAESDAFVFGSLSTRDPVSRATLSELLPAARFRIFDVNLRKPHYDTERVHELMKQADLVKLNDDELYELAEAFGSPYRSLEQNMRYLAGHTDTPHLCVTLGAHGAVYLNNGRFHAHHGYRVKVADTVGSGDSFLAGFIFKLLSGSPPEEILAFACAMGALNASLQGATPDLPYDGIMQLVRQQ